MKKTQYLIIGAGIIGLSIARALKKRDASGKILIIEKEQDTAQHASGRNSGVLHAGFYYTANSLKARFTVDGNRLLKEYCREKGLPLNECGKLVVAMDETELQTLYELEKRGVRNGVKVELIDVAAAKEIEPNIKTHQKALYSPTTASVDPIKVCQSLKEDLKQQGVEFQWQVSYVRCEKGTVETNQGEIEAKQVINCAGLYADKIAQDFDFGHDYTIMPFKGLYLKYKTNKTAIKTNIYPVPNLRNPFLGVHFTKTVYGDIKIGPTAIPAFWRENYQGFTNFQSKEFLQIMGYQSQLLLKNRFHFRNLAVEEMKKYQKSYFVGLAAKLVQQIDAEGFSEYTKPGIRAQLLDRNTLELVQDFVVEGDARSVHVLNAVSPAFTCAFPFAEHIVSQYCPA